MLPDRINQYTISALLHEGSIGPIYEGFDPEMQRTVAVKMLPLDLLPNQAYRDRLRQAIPLIKSFGDSNLVPIYNIGKADDGIFAVTKLIRGISLEQRMAQSELTLTESLSIYSQVAAALLQAHDKGVVHYNLRPSHILLDQNGRAHLTGFAMPLLTEVHSHVDPRHWLRYIAYLSPEQLTPGAELGLQGDIYGLGIILYQMLTGELPFQGTSVREMATQHRDSPVPGISYRNPIVPVELEYIVTQSLAKIPTDRFESFEDILVLLVTASLPIDLPSGMKLSPTTSGPGTPLFDFHAMNLSSPTDVDLSDDYDQPPSVKQSGSLFSRVPRRATLPLILAALVFFCCAAVLIAGAATFLIRPRLDTAEAVPLNRLATIPEHGVEMTLPENWLFQEAGPLTALDQTVAVTGAAAQQAPIDEFFNGIDLLEFRASDPLYSTMIADLDTVPAALRLPRALLLGFTNAIPISGVTFDRVRNTTVGGEAAAYADFTGVSLVDGQPFAGRIVAVIWTDRVGFFVGVSSADQWETYSPTFNAITDSIILTDPPVLIGP